MPFWAADNLRRLLPPGGHRGHNTGVSVEEKQSRVAEAIRRKTMRRIFFAALVMFVAGAAVWGGVWYSRSRAQSQPGRFVEDQGREHVGAEHKHTYNSNPPASGWHYSQPAEWGAYREELPDEVLIHNLEHGGVWISYRPDVSEEIRAKLEKFYEVHGRKIIVTPRAKNDTDIALAAWNRLDTFSVTEYSDERVERFIKAFRNKGPEFVP